MIETESERPPTLPRPPWIVRMLGPRPAATFGAQLGEVVRRTLWLLPVEFGLILALTAIGINVGNAGAQEIDDMLERGPAYFLALGAVIVPVLEELMFRLLPSAISDGILRRKHGQRWVLGFATALAFALAHNLSTEGGEHAIALTQNLYLYLSVPVSQFVFGLLLWDLMRRYGLWASAFSHMLHNFVFLSLAFAERSST